MEHDRYALGLSGVSGSFHEVTREQFIQAERAAGFHPKGGGDGVATGGFSTGIIRGSTIGPGHDFDEYLAWLNNDMREPAPRFDRDKFRKAYGYALD